MPRNTDLSTILFPVELRPVSFSPRSSEAAENQDDIKSNSGSPNFTSIKGYKAVVRVDTGAVFAVVSSRYELLHNTRALDLGKKAFEQLFPKTSATDFIIYDIQTTKSGSACHIDLIHSSYSTEVWEQETWLPFLRVSNSYNRSRALRFDFGFVRKLCSNGIIFQKETIQARFYHTRGELKIDLAQDTAFQRLKVLESEFSAHMTELRRTEIEQQYLLPLSIFLLGLEFDLQATNKKKANQEKEQFETVVEKLRETIGRYVKELGETAYTAINVATDIATHSPEIGGRFATSATLQEKIGERSREFLDRYSSPAGEHIDEILEEQLRLVG